jgi:hypothetical protein
MNVDWSHLLWQGRLEGLVLLWNATVTDVQTIWWFGPLLIVLIIAAGRKGIVRLGAYVLKVFIHTHGPS